MVVGNKIVFYTICFSILSIVFFKNIKLGKDVSFLCKANTDSFRGVAIVCIIFHHVIQQIKNPGLLLGFKGVGYLFVSCFFFLSGYGLTIAYLNNDNYLNKFLKKRLFKIYLPFVLVNFINLLIDILFFNESYTFIDFMKRLIGVILMSSAMWYVLAIIIWYISFYFVFKYIKESNNNIIIMFFSISLIWFIICNLLGVSKNWYDTSFIFPIGILVGLNKNYIKKIILKNYNKFLVITLIIFIIMFLLNYGKIDTFSVMIRSIASIAFTILFIIISIKVDISKNIVSVFLGSISLELFLIHDRLLDILNFGGIITGINLIMYFGIITVLAYILNKMFKYINFS